MPRKPAPPAKKTGSSPTTAAPVKPAAGPKPDVTMILTKFFEISASGKFCTLGDADNNPLAISPQGSGKGIRYPKGDPSINGILLLNPAPLVFTIENKDRDVTDVAIVGCFLMPKSTATVADNFTDIKWDPNQLKIKAEKKNPGHWKLFVAVTAQQQSATRLGIIDPDIENNAENIHTPPP